LHARVGSSQNLYRREPVPLPWWAVLRSPINHHSAHVPVVLAHALELTEQPQEAAGAVHAFDPTIFRGAVTRARLKLVLVGSEAAERVICERLQREPEAVG